MPPLSTPTEENLVGIKTPLGKVTITEAILEEIVTDAKSAVQAFIHQYRRRLQPLEPYPDKRAPLRHD